MKFNVSMIWTGGRCLVLLCCMSMAGKPISLMAQQDQGRILVMCSKERDHRKMISGAADALRTIASEQHFAIEITDDTSKITEANLAQYKLFIQLQLAPSELSATQQQALQHFAEQEKGWIGIHAAGLNGKQLLAPAQPQWKWYNRFLGGLTYVDHPKYQKAVVIVEDHEHPVTKNLPSAFSISDDWYEFDSSARKTVRVLATADESSYHPLHPMIDHPIIWTNEQFARMVYIGIGHDPGVWADPNYRILIRDAIKWATSTPEKAQ